MARKYSRDNRGRFASGGGGGGGGSKGKASGGGKKPKTAAGRASANLKAAEKARIANPRDKKAANKAITAQAAKDYYKTMGGGRKGAAKPQRKMTAAGAAAKPANKKAASPRRLNGDEQKVAKIMADKGLKSDRQRLAAAAKAGVKGDVRETYAKVKKKLGNPGGKTSDVATAKRQVSSALKKVTTPSGSAPKMGAAARKKALIRDASDKILSGKGKQVGKARRNYIAAQQGESLRMEKSGKGSKAARRIAKMRRGK